MATLEEQGQLFKFPDAWKVSKFDEWKFYRRQFSGIAAAKLSCSSCDAEIECAKCGGKRVAGSKGVDFLAIESNDDVWQIEVKDYRQTRESSFVFLADEVALKVRDTLACLVVARFHANDEDERQMAILAIGCKRIHVVLHLEQPQPSTRLDTKSQRSARAMQRLRQLLKAVDRRAMVLDQTAMDDVAWTVTDK